MKGAIIRFLATILILGMVMLPGAMAEEAVVHEQEVAGRLCYFYASESDLLGTRSCTCPIFLVFGSENYTPETAKQTAKDSGLETIAAREGSLIVFVNAMESGAWNAEADAAVYAGILDMFSDSSNSAWTAGKAEEVNFMSGQTATKYIGTSQRIYVFAEGAGADFVAENYMKQVVLSTTFPDGFTMTFDKSATAIALFNPTALPAIDAAAMGGYEVPTVIINGPDNAAEVVAALSARGEVFAAASTSGFDADAVAKAYADVVGTVRRQVSVLFDVPDYPALGIDTEIQHAETSEGTMEYHIFIPGNLDMAAEGTVPVVFEFHGGGNTAENHAWQSEWPLIGKEHGFICVSLQDHTSYTSSGIMELAQLLKAKYPVIDMTRLYASGFSMGGVTSWNIGMKQPLFAGVMPMDAGYMTEGTDGSLENVEIDDEIIMPVFYVAGGMSPLPELPHQQGEPNNVLLAQHARRGLVHARVEGGAETLPHARHRVLAVCQINIRLVFDELSGDAIHGFDFLAPEAFYSGEKLTLRALRHRIPPHSASTISSTKSTASPMVFLRRNTI